MKYGCLYFFLIKTSVDPILELDIIKYFSYKINSYLMLFQEF